MDANEVERILVEACTPHGIAVSEVQRHTAPVRSFSCRMERNGSAKYLGFLAGAVKTPEGVSDMIKQFEVAIRN